MLRYLTVPVVAHQEKPTTMSWTSPRPMDDDKIDAVHQALENDKEFNPGTGSDPYFGGKAFAKLARLALIGDELRSQF